MSGAHGLQFPYSPETIKNVPIYLTSDFGMRYNVETKETKMHYGIDLQSKEGTPICAAERGKVIKIGWEPNGAGRYVIIDHGHEVYTVYMHLQKDSVSKNGISEGTEVKAGQVIGNEGNTGGTYGETGVHLHFEVRLGGNHTKYAVDPKQKVFPWMQSMKKDLNNPIKFPI